MGSIRMAVPRLGSLLLSKRLLVSGKGAVTSTLGQSLGNNQAGFSTTTRLCDIFFTKKHEWVRVDGSKGTVGVSAYAADAGDAVEAGEECGALESVKAASDIYSPVTGTVAEKNEAVEDGPDLINQSPTGEGWLFSVTLSEPDQVSDLMSESDYQEYLKTCEEH